MQADMDWVEAAACANHPTLPAGKWVELPRGGHPSPEAVSVCLDECPVMVFCDRHASQHEEWGVWAGRTHFDRYGREPKHERSAVMVRPPRYRTRSNEEETA